MLTSYIEGLHSFSRHRKLHLLFLWMPHCNFIHMLDHICSDLFADDCLILKWDKYCEGENHGAIKVLKETNLTNFGESRNASPRKWRLISDLKDSRWGGMGIWWSVPRKWKREQRFWAKNKVSVTGVKRVEEEGEYTPGKARERGWKPPEPL